MSKVSYTFPVTNSVSYFRLIALCILSFLGLFMLFLVGLGAGLIHGQVVIGICAITLIGIPITLFYLRRKHAVNMITAWLDETSLVINWPDKSMTILFSEIKSYSADHIEGDESASAESVRIRLNNGKKVRFYATDNLCDIKPMGKFRADFDILAQKLNLNRKYFSW